uniref:Uncharacterized protein n=1 Tax=Lactuca sativa TaxID=4236 RepID=A0A9R1WM72_LACSA|nr:hypothetical protein LSAT_V11C100026520 [Lactuca sativa]
MTKNFSELGLRKEDRVEGSWIDYVLYWAYFNNTTEDTVLLTKILEHADWETFGCILHSHQITCPDIWQWSELTSFGDLPSPRDFATASAIGNHKIVMYGGWDGKKWLSDVFVLDTMSLEWRELAVTGTLPPPRCGHTATMVEKRLLVYGGRGGGGPIMGDLWGLKGLIEEDNEAPGWTQLKLPRQAPAARCGHTFTSGGHYLLMFGGHGTGGWLSRYDVYYNDCVVLDRGLEKIQLPRDDCYLPTAPSKLVRGIQVNSGIPLQSAAKVPIMITFDVFDRDGDPKDIKLQACIFKLRRYEQVIQMCEQNPNSAEEDTHTSPNSWRSTLIVKSYFNLGRLEEALEFIKKQETSGQITER